MRGTLPIITMIFAIGSHASLAADRLQVRPGMTLSEITRILQPKCKEYIVGGTIEKYVTCIKGEGRTPAVVTATVSAKDRTYYIQWRDLVGPDLPPGYARDTARQLGFGGEKPDCVIYGKPRTCWTDGTGTLLYDAGYVWKTGLQIFYLDNDSIRKADAK